MTQDLELINEVTNHTGADHCYDNAFAESFFSRLKNELLRGMVFETKQQAESTVFELIETIYNRVRLHSSLGYQSPAEFEKNIA